MNCIKKEKYIKYININLLKPKGKTNSICMDMIKVEVDELWSFVKNKKKQRWLWYAINYDIREILAYTFGKRKDTVFLKLKKLLEGF
jgi:transposase-like protein